MLDELRELAGRQRSKTAKEPIDRALTYFTRHRQQMNYADYRASCKTLQLKTLTPIGACWTRAFGKRDALFL